MPGDDDEGREDDYEDLHSVDTAEDEPSDDNRAGDEQATDESGDGAPADTGSPPADRGADHRPHAGADQSEPGARPHDPGRRERERDTPAGAPERTDTSPGTAGNPARPEADRDRSGGDDGRAGTFQSGDAPRSTQPGAEPTTQAGGPDRRSTEPAPQAASPGDLPTDVPAERMIAYLFDFVLLSVASVVTFLVIWVGGAVVLAVAEPFAAGEAGPAVMLLFLLVWLAVGAIVFGYYVLLDARGGTLGKRILDLRVVAADGSPASTGQVAIRTAVLMAPFPLMALVGSVVPFLGFLIAVGLLFVWLVVEGVVMLLSSRGQRLGDKAASTYVVDEG